MKTLKFLLMLGLLAFAFVLSVSVGVADIGLFQVWRLVLIPDSSQSSLIVHTLRLPRAVLGLVVGASLAVSACILHGITRNPLVGPGVLGVNAGAALGVVVGLVFLPGIPLEWFVLLGFIGGFSAAALTFSAALGVGITPLRLALSGIAVGALLSALSSAIQLLFEERARAVTLNLLGSLAGRTWQHVTMVLPWFIGCLVLTLLLGQVLNLLSLSDDTARGLGLRVGWARLGLAVLAVLFSSLAVSVAGAIGFLGMMSPHLARALVGSDHRFVLPMSALVGSSLLLFADVAARLIAPPLETPVGVLAVAIGAPFFVYLVRRQNSA